MSDDPISLRTPTPEDGAPIHNLIRKSAFLDDNSLYCYLVICTHFADTSVVATMGDDVVGVVTGYIPPKQPDTLFIWQVAVDTLAQKRGLAGTMLRYIVAGNADRGVHYLETTVTRDNQASRAMFNSLAKKLDCEMEESLMFDRRRHFLNLHDSEYKLCLGPFDATGLEQKDFIK